MTKRVLRTIAALWGFLAIFTACQDEALPGEASDTAREGYVSLRFSADIPDMTEVNTRSVDPNGGGVQNMTLFCFDRFGFFITTVRAKDVTYTQDNTGKGTGTFDAEVPDNTRTIHFLANQIMDDFPEDSFRNKPEADVLALLEGSSGMMIYWGRFACDRNNTDKINKQLEAAGKKIQLIRNHARVSVENPTDNGYITITGMVVYNTQAFGTVAPYHPTKGFNFTWPSADDPFVTLPANRAIMSDISDVTTNMAQYVFECENSADSPVSVILRGRVGNGPEMYYRVMLVDDEGGQIMLRRNHHYKLNIKGALSFGQSTFEQALEASATNNVWISISDEVDEVEDADYVLKVEQTSYVLDGEFTDNKYVLKYTVTGKKGKVITLDDAAEISWLDGNEVAGPDLGKNFRIENGVGKGEITIYRNKLGNSEKLEGTLLVKKGRLQRKIKVITVKQQKFEPAWVGTQIYGKENQDDKEKRAHVTIMFNIPETCPEELLPLRVLLTVDELDVRNAAGMELPIIFESQDGYGEKHENDCGYKYEYIVEKTGVQRVYLENILNQEIADKTGTITIEAEHFALLTKIYSFSTTDRSITVEGLSRYNHVSGDGFADDEDIFYRLVPQKKGATVQFDMVMKNENDAPFNVGEKDEFLLYSQYLDHYENEEEQGLGVTFDCEFYDVPNTNWSTGGRVMAFVPRIPGNPSKGTGRYSIYMKTNRAKSAEVVRIASNQHGSPAVLGEHRGDDGMYGGNAYRSVTFELANNNPFRFSAQLGVGRNPQALVGNTDVKGEAEEEIDRLEWTYAPEQEVTLEFDVTSFMGTDGESADPFGNKFEIYIDAPMLEIDGSRLSDCKLTPDKLKAHPTIEGRFVYTVEASREAEDDYGVSEALKQDASNSGKTGERKRLPFKIKKDVIVSAGDIVLSSDEEEVVFFSKTFRVTNKSISGHLSYPGGDVPANAFVSFERVKNGSRIGSITVGANGQYELRLRKEYNILWINDPVELHYQAGDGKVYHKTYQSLSDLFGRNGEDVDIVLDVAQLTQ
ncbi:MAG: hypothetical protein KH111_07005 [Bacteroidales bacterium]|nr:hypothetical protein [Bacteroidales bacterium]